jgi:hypothetical protein
MAWTAARTWVTGELVTSTIMNAHVRDNLNYLFSTTGEIAYQEFTSAVSTTATTEGGSTQVVSAGAITFDGSTPVMICFFAPFATTAGAADGTSITFLLFDSGSVVGQLGVLLHPGTGASGQRGPIYLERRLTPTNASHTYIVRIIESGGTASVSAGTGGSGTPLPGFIRIKRTS